MIRTNFSRFIIAGTITEHKDKYIIVTLGDDDTRIELVNSLSKLYLVGRKVVITGTIHQNYLIAEEIRGQGYGKAKGKTTVIHF